MNNPFSVNMVMCAVSDLKYGISKRDRRPVHLCRYPTITDDNLDLLIYDACMPGARRSACMPGARRSADNVRAKFLRPMGTRLQISFTILTRKV